MQHAEKEKKKKVLKHKFRIFPHKLKKESKVPQKKKHLQTKAQSELYRDARAAFNKYLYTKKKIKTSKVPL